jgi:alpha-maltose-1-phosphate synthase
LQSGRRNNPEDERIEIERVFLYSEAEYLLHPTMPPRIAFIRGPNLNAWEMQNFSPLAGRYDLVGFGSTGNNFDTSEIPFPVRSLFSIGQSVRSRAARALLERWWGDYHDLQGLKRALQGFNIVHTAETMYYCSYQTALLKRRLGFKLAVTVWENIPFNYNAPATRRIKETVFREADVFFAVSRRTRDVLVLEGVPADRIVVQMPGIDIDHFSPRPKDPRLLARFGCTPDDLLVLFVAHLYVQKGVYDLLFAVYTLLRRHGARVPIKLLIAGRGPEAAGLRRLISQLNLGQHVRLIGPHPYSAMPAIHALADVFALPSQPIRRWQEQFGYVLVESMACGKPVVTTTSGSIPEVVGDAAVLVPPADYLALAEALDALLSSPDRRAELGRSARSRALTTFDTRQVAQQFQKQYEHLLAGNPGPPR